MRQPIAFKAEILLGSRRNRDYDLPMKDSKNSRWTEYNKAESPPRPRLVATLDHEAPTPGHALDLGCGSGRDTRELLRRGWSVDAVDSDADSLEKLKESLGISDLLKVIESGFEALTLVPKTYDLINASYSLPFCKPQAFQNFWNGLVDSLKPGGILTCELFGINDQWAQQQPSGSVMSFHSRAQVDELLKDFKIEKFEEKEFDGPTFAGPQKHWHIYLCVVRKV